MIAQLLEQKKGQFILRRTKFHVLLTKLWLKNIVHAFLANDNIFFLFHQVKYQYIGSQQMGVSFSESKVVKAQKQAKRNKKEIENISLQEQIIRKHHLDTTNKQYRQVQNIKSLGQEYRKWENDIKFSIARYGSSKEYFGARKKQPYSKDALTSPQEYSQKTNTKIQFSNNQYCLTSNHPGCGVNHVFDCQNSHLSDNVQHKNQPKAVIQNNLNFSLDNIRLSSIQTNLVNQELNTKNRRCDEDIHKNTKLQINKVSSFCSTTKQQKNKNKHSSQIDSFNKFDWEIQSQEYQGSENIFLKTFTPKNKFSEKKFVFSKNKKQQMPKFIPTTRQNKFLNLENNISSQESTSISPSPTNRSINSKEGSSSMPQNIKY